METAGTTDVHELLKKYRNLDEWSQVMRDAGLKTSNLIFGEQFNNAFTT